MRRHRRTQARFEGTPAGLRMHAPMLGEHTDAILGELGVASSRIGELYAEGVVA